MPAMTHAFGESVRVNASDFLLIGMVRARLTGGASERFRPVISAPRSLYGGKPKPLAPCYVGIFKRMSEVHQTAPS
jgi:hypothetical protein